MLFTVVVDFIAPFMARPILPLVPELIQQEAAEFKPIKQP
jgi:hypothetical protein